VLRATGLSIKTPQLALDSVLGTDLQRFVDQMIIMNGLKIIGPSCVELMDRTLNFRFPYILNTYMYKFAALWNSQHLEFKLHVKTLLENTNINFDAVKRFLKDRRSIKYQPDIHTTYKYTKYVKDDGL